MTFRNETTAHDVVVIGAGFGGVYLIHLLRDRLGLDVVAFESGDDVGGTWYWNRYPGARCDVESMFYCFTFDSDILRDWTWSERYAAQPEILRYIQHVADHLDVRRSISFGTVVVSATWREDTHDWRVMTNDGVETTARFVVSAVGCLSVPLQPAFSGMEDFRGSIYHTGQWPREGVDLTGKRVAVIGTGSSGVQAIPEIAKQAATTTVYQRTATFTVPANNRPLTEIEIQRTKRQYPELIRRARDAYHGFLQELAIGDDATTDPETLDIELERRWWTNALAIPATLSDVLTSRIANERVSEFVRAKVRETVADPRTAEALVPRDYPIGTKRLVLDTDYLETFNRPDVDIVDLRETPLIGFTPSGVATSDGEREYDVVVLATGYDAMTGALRRIDIAGVDGVRLSDAWAAGPHTYLGLAMHGFPNFFTVTGPGSPSVFSNMVASIEQHVEWIGDLLQYCGRNGIDRIEAALVAQEEWTAHVNALAAQTLLPETASWYMGANIPGKPRVFMPYTGGLGAYRRRCAEVADSAYAGFSGE